MRVYERMTCRLCGSKVAEVLRLTPTPIANSFPAKPDAHAERIPLNLMQCGNCQHVQCSHVPRSELLYSDYKYSTPDAVRPHLEAAAQMMRATYPQAKRVLEIGSNNGLNLAVLAGHGFDAVGVDPAAQEAHNAVQSCFTPDVARWMGRFDIIVANNVLAHIDDLDSVFEGVRKCLAPDGVLIFEVQYLRDMVLNVGFDMNQSQQSSAIVVIYDHEKQDGRASEKEGRPVFKTEPFIKIDFPGDSLTSIDRPLREKDKLEYAKEWERYQNKEKSIVDGTPLAHWPMMTRLQVAELNALNIWTVEQLVSLPQVHAHKVMGFEMLKGKAKQFLDIARAGANAEAVAEANRVAQEALAKRDAENAALQAQLAQQAIQIQALQTAMANMATAAAQPRRRGRPPKDKS